MVLLLFINKYQKIKNYNCLKIEEYQKIILFFINDDLFVVLLFFIFKSTCYVFLLG